MKVLLFLLPLFLAGCVSRGDRELLAEFSYDSYIAGRGTPAEYATGRIAGAEAVAARRILKGDLAGDKEGARAFLRTLLADIRAGYDWPEKAPPKVDIPRIALPPLIDGRINEAEWRGALVFEGEYPLGSRTVEASGARWFVCWDEDYLYAAAAFPEPFPDSNAKTPWNSDALELFVGTSVRYRNYWEAVVSPGGHLYDALCWNNIWNWYLSLPEEHIEGLKHAGAITKDGYSVEIAFPWQALPAYSRGNVPKPGEAIHFTLIRCRKGVQSACHPLLYGGHNLFGHLQGILR